MDFLSCINDNYGEDGDDSVWFTSQEEYYEYNYYRIHGGSPTLELVNDSTLKVSVSLPSKTYFYYPSTTVNINGIKTVNIKSIDTNYAITGFSYADFKDGITVNVDCRRYLLERAEHFTTLYENNKTNESLKRDAVYFVAKLKDSEEKTNLLARLNNENNLD